MDDPKAQETYNILLIEDNHADARMINEIFKEFNKKIKLYTINNGAEALKFLNKKEKNQNMLFLDLVLLDLNIPLINGFEILKEIKSSNKLKNIPVIILTTSTNKEDFLKARKLQADCFITKPLYYHDYNNVLKHIEECWLKAKSSP